MRTKDKQTLQDIKQFIDDYCDANARGPSVGEIAKKWGMSKSTAQSYLAELKANGEIAQSSFGYESILLAESRSTQSVPILGAVPCGPLTDVEE